MEPIHSPPDLITSLLRSVICMKPSASIVATSPVGNQPSTNGSSPSPPRYCAAIQGPRTISSPLAWPSQGSSIPSSPTIFMSTPNTARPCLAWIALRCDTGSTRCEPLSTPTVPTGLSSVIPQAWITCTLWRSWKARIIAGGHAEPPMMVRRIDPNTKSLASTCASRPCHTVGTPAETVTPSLSINSWSEAPSSAGPGNTSFAPTMHAAYGSPHAFTWNIGTTGSTASCEDRFSESGSAEA